MIKNILSKNITELYNIIEISNEGIIKVKDDEMYIYRIEPANVVAYDDEAKRRIYQAYLTCIRGLPNAYQVLISKEKTSFKSQIAVYKQRLLEIENFGLKEALKKYIEYLEELETTNKLYQTNHYLIVKNLNKNDATEILNIFANLREFGMRVNLIDTKKEADKVLRQAMLQNRGDFIAC